MAFQVGPNRAYVGNIPFKSTSEDIRNRFSEYGNITIIDMKQGFCFLEYDSEGALQKAISATNNTDFMGYLLKVEKARPPKESSLSEEGCYTCGSKAHFARECPERYFIPLNIRRKRSTDTGLRRHTKSRDSHRRSRSRSRSPSYRSSRRRSRSRSASGSSHRRDTRDRSRERYRSDSGRQDDKHRLERYSQRSSTRRDSPEEHPISVNNVNPNRSEYYPNNVYPPNMMVVSPGQYAVPSYGIPQHAGSYQVPGVMSTFPIDQQGQANYYRGGSLAMPLPPQTQIPNFESTLSSSGQPSTSTYPFTMSSTSAPIQPPTYVSSMPHGSFSYMQHSPSVVPPNYYYQQSGYQGIPPINSTLSRSDPEYSLGDSNQISSPTSSSTSFTPYHPISGSAGGSSNYQSGSNFINPKFTNMNTSQMIDSSQSPALEGTNTGRNIPNINSNYIQCDPRTMLSTRTSSYSQMYPQSSKVASSSGSSSNVLNNSG